MKQHHLDDLNAVKEHVAWIYQFIEQEEGRLKEKYIDAKAPTKYPLGGPILRKTGFHLEMLTRDIEQRLRGG